MKQYVELIQAVSCSGFPKKDRTGTGTCSIFGYQERFRLMEGFPLLTTKRVHWKSVVEELLWFLRAEHSISSLQERGVSIWDEWAAEDGYVGPIYGVQWRRWEQAPRIAIDQLQNVIDVLKTDPDSRRLIVSAWNVGEIDQMALPPCPMLFQFYSRELHFPERFQTYTPERLIEGVAEEMHEEGPPDLEAIIEDLPRRMDAWGVPRRALSCRVDQRSADVGLGVPFNWAGYALLTHIVAALTGHGVGEMIWQAGDVHIYNDHADALKMQMERSPRRLPRLRLPDGIADMSLDEIGHELTADDFELVGYDPHPAIKMKVSV